jgi:serine/threonine protein kinase
MFVTFMNVINGVSEYHKRNFYHLDLKSENMIFNSYVKEERMTKYMKMIDFGLSAMLNTFDTDTNKYDLQMLHNRPIDLFLIQNPLFKDTRHFNFPGVIAMLKDINGGTVPTNKQIMRKIKELYKI